MNAARGIEAVTFDAAGTLFFPQPSVGAIYQEILAEHGLLLDPLELESAFRDAFKTTAKDVAIADPEERERIYWKAVVAESIRPLASIPSHFETIFEALWQAFAKGTRWKLNDDTLEIFQFLDSREIPFALLTNWDRRVRSVLLDHNLDNRFSHIFISSEIGAEKPDRALFDYASKSLGLRSERILHIGDHIEQDVLGARKAGWQAAHFAPSPSKFSIEIPSLHRLLDLTCLIDGS